MFNIVKRRDFMLAGDLPTKEEAEKLRDRYGAEYVVVETVSGRRLTGNTFTRAVKEMPLRVDLDGERFLPLPPLRPT
jgi:hypothetical protein